MIINILHRAFLLMALLCTSCCRPTVGFTPEEHRLIPGTDSTLRVLTIEDSLDLTVLRASSQDLTYGMLLSDEFKRLSELMIATVTHPSQDGVGIAGPQVGLNRRVVAVQRFDKEGEPFDVYPNVRIVWASDSLVAGPEGCLSVPGRRGEVLRSQEIVIEYTDLAALDSLDAKMSPRKLHRHFSSAPLPTVRDTISGFTAVIFQHETDHLDGILYIDRLEQ